MFRIDWQRYYELEKKKLEDITKEEWEFFKYMQDQTEIKGL